jgi:hypothetical protein
MGQLTRSLLQWLPLGVAITILCVLVYGAVQQDYRQSLNDPQVQMAEDGAYALSKGDVPAAIVPRGVAIDLRLSLAPWIAVYDSSGKGLESSGVLDGAPPAPPLAVMQAASNGQGKDTPNRDENRVTWEPTAGVRQAIVVVPVAGPGNATKYYVVAGRNMREVEDREQRLSQMVLLAWFLSVVASLGAGIIAEYAKSRP